MSGFGSSPYGSGPYGIGEPVTAPIIGGSILRDAKTGLSTGSRAINPVTRDYVLDSNGRPLGMNDVQQLVLVAVTTVKNSTAMHGLGQTLGDIEIISDDIQRRVTSVLEAALAHLTSRKLIAIVNVTVQKVRPGAVAIRLRWRDLSTTKEHELEI